LLSTVAVPTAAIAVAFNASRCPHRRSGAAATTVYAVVVVISNAFFAIAVAAAGAIAVAVAIAATSAVVDCNVFSPPRLISIELVEGGITHDPINARHRLEPAPEGQRRR